MAKSLMIMGTSSKSGKSFLISSFCKTFSEDGYSTVPFKAQSITLNTEYTSDGFEIDAEIAAIARVAGKEPSSDMNPILLKPCSDDKFDVTVAGKLLGEMTFEQYIGCFDDIIPDILLSYNNLASENDIVIIESSAHPESKNTDCIDGFYLAKLTKSPVIIISDYKIGGAFSAAYGAFAFAEEENQKYIQGIIINNLKGDPAIHDAQFMKLRSMTGLSFVAPFENIDINFFKEQFEEKPTAANAIEESTAFVADNSVVMEESTASVVDDGIIMEENTASVVDDGIIMEENTASVADDSVVIEENTASIVDDGIIMEENTASVADDSIVMEENTASVADDSVVIEENTASIVDDGIIMEENTASVVDDSVVIEENTASVADDSIVMEENTASVVDDSVVIEESTASVADDSVIMEESTASVADDSIVMEESTAPVADDSVAIEENTASIVDDGIIMEESTVSIADDSVIMEESQMQVGVEHILPGVASEKNQDENYLSEIDLEDDESLNLKYANATVEELEREIALLKANLESGEITSDTVDNYKTTEDENDLNIIFKESSEKLTEILNKADTNDSSIDVFSEEAPITTLDDIVKDISEKARQEYEEDIANVGESLQESHTRIVLSATDTYNIENDQDIKIVHEFNNLSGNNYTENIYETANDISISEIAEDIAKSKLADENEPYMENYITNISGISVEKPLQIDNTSSAEIGSEDVYSNISEPLNKIKDEDDAERIRLMTIRLDEEISASSDAEATLNQLLAEDNDMEDHGLLELNSLNNIQISEDEIEPSIQNNSLKGSDVRRSLQEEEILETASGGEHEINFAEPVTQEDVPVDENSDNMADDFLKERFLKNGDAPQVRAFFDDALTETYNKDISPDKEIDDLFIKDEEATSVFLSDTFITKEIGIVSEEERSVFMDDTNQDIVNSQDHATESTGFAEDKSAFANAAGQSGISFEEDKSAFAMVSEQAVASFAEEKSAFTDQKEGLQEEPPSPFENIPFSEESANILQDTNVDREESPAFRVDFEENNKFATINLDNNQTQTSQNVTTSNLFQQESVESEAAHVVNDESSAVPTGSQVFEEQDIQENINIEIEKPVDEPLLHQSELNENIHTEQVMPEKSLKEDIRYVNDEATNLLPANDNTEISDKDKQHNVLAVRSTIVIAIIRFPNEHYTTSFNFLAQKGAELVYIESAENYIKPDFIVLPDTLKPMSDIAWMKNIGLDNLIKQSAEEGAIILGIGGGFHTLFNTISDPHKRDLGGEIKGLNLLNTTVSLNKERRISKVRGIFKSFEGIFTPLNGKNFEGQAVFSARVSRSNFKNISVIIDKTTGIATQDGLCYKNIFGLNVFGILENNEMVHVITKILIDFKKNMLISSQKIAHNKTMAFADNGDVKLSIDPLEARDIAKKLEAENDGGETPQNISVVSDEEYIFGGPVANVVNDSLQTDEGNDHLPNEQIIKETEPHKEISFNSYDNINDVIAESSHVFEYEEEQEDAQSIGHQSCVFTDEEHLNMLSKYTRKTLNLNALYEIINKGL